MGRTLHYSLFGDEQLPLAERREIELAQRMLNHHFTWTCENLGFDLFDALQLTYSDAIQRNQTPWMPRLGTGFTKVAEDEWNAQVVVAFVQWVSSRLPNVTVRLYDEGDYIPCGYLWFQRGIPALDLPNIARWHDYLRSNGRSDALAQLDEAEKQAKRGIFFASVNAAEYADRSEIKELGLTDKELAKMTLKEVSDAVTMPWQTEWLKAA